jgi:H+/Cl- antiporter ClcA
MVLPALTAAATSYLVFVALRGTVPLLPVSGAPPFNLRDLGGVAAVGLLCGAGARGFAWLLRRAKRLAARSNPLMRALAAGGLLAGLFAVSQDVDRPRSDPGPGYRTVAWSTDSRHGIFVVIVMFIARGSRPR